MTDIGIDSVLDFYRHHFRQSSPNVTGLGGAGGYSGAEFWKISDGDERYCLRRWPESFQDEERLDWIHKVVLYAASEGCDFLPVPFRSRDERTWCKTSGCLWQLDPWVTGTASFWSSPSEPKLASAAQALATFHRATVAFRQPTDKSPSIQSRLSMLTDLMAEGKDGVKEIEKSCSQRIDANLYEVGLTICDRFGRLAPTVRGELERASTLMVEPQPCLADIWHDHIFFTADKVSGIIDFGAMRHDSPSLDVSRLFGSLVGDDKEKWSFAISQYEQIHPLSESDKKLVSIFDQSTTLLAGMNWLRWIYVERRAFDEMGSIAERLRKIAKRMDVLIADDQLCPNWTDSTS